MSESIQSQGGKARAEVLTPTERTDIARKAAQTRWSNQPCGVVTRCFTFPIVSGIVNLSVPFPMSEDDYASLMEILKIMKAGLVRMDEPPGPHPQQAVKELK